MCTRTEERMTLKKTNSSTVIQLLITTLTSLLPSGDSVERPPLAKGNRRIPPLLAFPGAFVLNASALSPYGFPYPGYFDYVSPDKSFLTLSHACRIMSSMP
jgi:hypothetical protein